MRGMGTIALAALVAAVAGIARAAPPPDADPALAPWFDSLRQPGTGARCCSISDCRQTDSRMVDGHYEALIGKRWVTVPDDKILQRTDNPTGRAVLCWMPPLGILCFVRPPET